MFPVEFGMDVKISTGKQYPPHPVEEKSGIPFPVGSHQGNPSRLLDRFEVTPQDKIFLP